MTWACKPACPSAPRIGVYLKPAFHAIYGACKEAGAIVRVHTDGHILPIIDDLIECGVYLESSDRGQ